MSAGKLCRTMKCSGFSLMELMISLVLGLIVIAVMLGIYLSNTQTARFHSSNLKVQENGRFAIDVISRTVRMAGYDDPMTATNVSAPLVNGSMVSTGALITQTGLKPTGDTLSVRFEGGTKIRDCQGQPVAADDWVTNMYAVSTDNNLVCATFTNNSAVVSDSLAMAEGVEDMRVLYGLDLDESGNVNRYVRSQAVSDWSQVISFRIALLVNSINPVLNTDDTVCLGCVVFSGTADRLIRQEFQTTIEIRN
jgi:type IV pilus assembly protein PilW